MYALSMNSNYTHVYTHIPHYIYILPHVHSFHSLISGNIEEAKEYLRAAKGFDSVIEAAKGGLAVDLKSLPLPPKVKNDLEHT